MHQSQQVMSTDIYIIVLLDLFKEELLISLVNPIFKVFCGRMTIIFFSYVIYNNNKFKYIKSH